MWEDETRAEVEEKEETEPIQYPEGDLWESDSISSTANRQTLVDLIYARLNDLGLSTNEATSHEAQLAPSGSHLRLVLIRQDDDNFRFD